MPTANEIRQQFIDFFVKKHGHTFVPSSPVVPQDDPTLLFTNAGMNQFKPYFLGVEQPPWKRVANTQKCIRAGGKHNDLDDVGKDTYHHTFFEMLGNWSFGDYFKKEAIAWAWELLTEVWKLDRSRLHVTVFEGSAEEGVAPDDEAAEYWRTQTDIDPSHIHKFGKKDNFWEMGDTGPCGPCSEIHYDRTKDKSGGKLVNEGSPDVIEIWNLVFIQFNRGADRKLTPLPAKHVDTGMGFERVTAVLQGKESNYDTDVFAPIMNAIAELTGRHYGGRLDDPTDTAFRVVADHLRMAVFAIADGAMPDNKERGSVLRSVIRRAVRFSWQYFGQREAFLYQLIPALVVHMGGAFPELRSNYPRAAEILRREETEFLRTIERGLGLFEEWAILTERIASGDFSTGEGSVEEMLSPKWIHPKEVALFEQAGKLTIPGEAVFKLHETYGFPPDLTLQMARERGLVADLDGYKRLMEGHKRVSGSGAVKAAGTTGVSVQLDTQDNEKWTTTETEGKLAGWLNPDQVFPPGRSLTNERGERVIPTHALMAEKTCFYSEGGGQVGDKGIIETSTGVFEVADTIKKGKTVFHLGRVIDGTIEGDQTAFFRVSQLREFTRKNHTATHLLNWGLREVLGHHIEQRGSLVDHEKTRFDFTHDKAITADELEQIERLVNERIYADLPITAIFMPLDEAKKIPGVRAVFGEKYPDPVRVLAIGVERPEDATPDHSVEFCGGTHVSHTGQIGFFKIISQEPVSKGVRRVTAVTGREAVAYVQRQSAVLDELSSRFNCKPEELPERVAALQDEIKKLQQQLKKGAATDLQGAADKLLASATEVNGAKLIIGEMPAGPEETMRQQVDRLRQKATSSVVVLGWADDGKVGLIAAVTDDLVKKGLHAGKLIGQVAKVVGGGGGGKPTMAQAGGKDPAKLDEALQLARTVVGEQIKG